MYNRLFTKILDSSIWLEPDSTRIVWVTLLATMDQDGYCHFSAIENLASRARVSVAKTRRAIECFESPDPNSENMANEGRRIERVPGGYLVLNADYYRKKFTREIEREQTRLRVAKHRAKKGKCNNSTVTEALHSVSPVSASVSASESESVWLEELSTDKAYEGINVQHEHAKMVRWCKEHKVQPTRKRFINWLNRADKPLSSQSKERNFVDVTNEKRI